MRLRILFVLWALLVWTCIAFGQSVILPAKASGEVNEWIIVAPKKENLKVEFALVKWRASPGLIEVPVEELFPGYKGKIYKSRKAGRYKVEAWVEADAKLPMDKSAVLAILIDKTLTDAVKVENAAALLQGISVCNVTIGEPGPEPDPKPPDPKPPEPSPDNPFVAVWKLETNTKRAPIAAVIAGLYRGYAEEAKTATTGKALFDFMSNAYLAAKSGGEPIQGKLTKLVPVINQWIATNLKTPEGQLSQADRAAAQAAFLKIAAWLGELN